MIGRQQRYFQKAQNLNEKQLRNEKMIEKSESQFLKNRRSIEIKSKIQQWEVQERQKKRDIKQKQISMLKVQEEVKWMKEHKRLIEEADYRQARFMSVDADKQAIIKQRGLVEKHKLLQAVEAREQKERELEQTIQTQLVKLQKKQCRSSTVQSGEILRKASIAQKYNDQLSGGKERARIAQK